MKISMSYSGGTSRGLQLASQFNLRGDLDRMYIPYYSQKHRTLTRLFNRVEDHDFIHPVNVQTNLWFALLRKLVWNTVGRKYPEASYFVLGAILDRWVAGFLDPRADVMLAESNMALHTLRKAKRSGAIAILDMTSLHIKDLNDVRSVEYRLIGKEYRPVSRRIARGLLEYAEADYIVVPSTIVERQFIEGGIPREKLLLVTPGIETAYFRQKGKRDDVFRIIYVGGIHIDKGIRYLLEAFSALKPRRVELLLIGSIAKDVRPFLDRLAEGCRLIGFIKYDELFEWYSQGSVFVFPSLKDSFGKVVLEAMSCGLPVIVTENCGAKNVVREGIDGFVVPIRDVNAMVEKITYLYDHEDERQKMGEHAEARVKAEFTLEKYADRMLDALGKVLGNRASAS